MAMVYQNGKVYEKGKRAKKWYGQFRLYMRDRNGKEVVRTRKVILGLKSELRKYQAEEKLRDIIRKENGKIGLAVPAPPPDDSVTFKWFVKEKYLPICRGRWRTATRERTEHEIKKYLVDKFKDVPLRNIGLFELQTRLNDLAEKYSESIVKHSFVNLRSIMRMAQRLKFISDNPGEETRMPATRPIERPTMTPEQINLLIEAIEDPHDLCLMCIGLFCATRTSETFGLQWKSYGGDSLMIHSTAYEGELYRGQVKTEASRNAVPIPDDIVPIIEAWRQICPDTSPDALMFPTHGKGERAGSTVPRRAKSFLKWRIHPIAKKMKVPRRLVTFQVMRRTLGTDLQQHGTIKDAQGVLRHASIKTTGDVYVQQIPQSVRAAINSRTRAILAQRRPVGEQSEHATRPKTRPNASQLEEVACGTA
ncbi:MAG TPA: site-specific integrase [Candidatus Acidoferrum sp.]|nr:site-specific integrase [Candidatus Acidoferrum sp.]